MRALLRADDSTAAAPSIHLLGTRTDEQTCLQHTGFGAATVSIRSGFLWDRVLAALSV